jgi:hypothetical protein
VSDAPICNNAPPSAPGQPSPKTLPSIPPATDLQSAIMAVNAIRRILQTMIQTPPQGGISGFRLRADRGFQEVKQRRVTKRVRIFNPSDKSQYVDVEQVVGIVMQDPVTGNTWSWNQ